MGIFDMFARKQPQADIPINKMVTEAGKQFTDWAELGKGLFNPDDIGIDTYKYMIKTDAQIKAGYSLIKLATLSRKWKVTSLTSGQEKIDFINFNFEQMEGRLMGSISKLLTAILYGFSTTEIVWKIYEEGKYKGKIGIKKLKDLDPSTITFKTDDFGNLTEVLQMTGDMTEDEAIHLPLEKLIIYTEDKQFGNMYGNSRLRSIYKNWFIKETLIRFWNIALERWGQPLIIGTVPTTADLDRMISILDNLQNKSSIAKTEGWEVAALETGIGRSSGGDYKNSIEYHNSQILRGMLVPSLLVGSGESSGSNALGQTHFDIFALMIQNLEKDINGIIEKFLIQPLIKFNFGPQDTYPNFQFEPLTKQDLFNLARTFSLLVKNGVINPEEQFIRDMMSLPHMDEAVAGTATTSSGKNKKVVVKPSQQIKTPKMVADGLTKKEPRG